GLARLGHLSIGARGAHDQDPLRPVLVSERESFGDRRHAQRGRPGAERSTGDVDRAVSVTVRLDDRPEAWSVEGAQQRAHVAPEGAEIDGDLRTVHQASASGRESMTSDATSPT